MGLAERTNQVAPKPKVTAIGSLGRREKVKVLRAPNMFLVDTNILDLLTPRVPNSHPYTRYTTLVSRVLSAEPFSC